MESETDLQQKEAQVAELLKEASHIVQIADAQSRVLTTEEDASVLEIMAQARHLEEEIGHLKRQAGRA
jgi:hypothetical protein